MREQEKSGESREQLVVAAQEWLGRRGIKLILWDLDDTLLQTYELFLEKINKFYELTRSRFLMEMNREEFRETIYSFVADVYGEQSVNPNFWEAVVARLGEEYPEVGLGVFESCLPVLQEVYQEAPDLKPGALEILEIFRGTGVRMAVLTHASEEWTAVKLECHGLGDFFEQILTVDVDEFKGAEHWQKAITELGVDPQNVLVIGDSVRGDMVAQKVGVENLICVKSTWQLYSQGEMPVGVIEVESLGKILDVLLEG